LSPIQIRSASRKAITITSAIPISVGTASNTQKATSRTVSTISTRSHTTEQQDEFQQVVGVDLGAVHAVLAAGHR